MMETKAKDLPLSSLMSSCYADHYIIKLDCLIEEKCFLGEVLIFLGPLGFSGDHTIILDLNDIDVKKVEEVEATADEVNNMTSELKSQSTSCLEWLTRPKNGDLDFAVEEWCVKIKVKGTGSDRVLRISFRTRPSGKSILWIPDDDGNPCSLTAGSLINNRSLFPHQDAPNLMATWQLVIKIPEYFVVATTGDEGGSVTDDGWVYFHTQMLLPLSTFAFAIGQWQIHAVPMNLKIPIESCTRVIKCCHSTYPCSYGKNDPGPGIATRIFYCSSAIISPVIDYLPRCYETLYDILGRQLVPKMDIVILPKTVSYLGLASPGLIFLSPSVLYGSSPMLERLGHEISHSWFGVHIGPKNWEEEWISEGFATFMEVCEEHFVCAGRSIQCAIFNRPQDITDVKISSDRSPQFREQWIALKAMNRFEILKSDCQNLESSTQCASSVSEETNMVRNALSPDRLVSQIPYAKGYFFLYRLSLLIGLEGFLLSLKRYVEHFHGTLISTAECVDFFCCQHEEHRALINEAAHKWLYSDRLADYVIDPGNSLYQEVMEHYKFWKRRVRKKSNRSGASTVPQWSSTTARSDQLVSLLDKLLLLDCPLHENVLKLLMDSYQPHLVNATAYHRLCELIVSNGYEPGLGLVSRFLANHVAMGAYLYGELMISDVECFHELARQVYARLEPSLETDFRELLREMLATE